MFNVLKGTHDVIKDEALKYSYIEETLTNIAINYGYEEFRTPVIENSELFTRSVGDSSDIVRKEMYTFDDKGGRSITLRPEMTAGIVRSMVNAKLFAMQDFPVKAFYCGPNFRYERPQQGRYRQFNQFGVECVGVSTVERDVETIVLGYHMLQFLRFRDLKLLINTLGDEETRENYKKALKEYFGQHIDEMCNDCKERYKLNILRILDCKDPDDRPIIDKAPKITDYLSDAARERFEKIKEYLTKLEIPFEVDSELVRGLDYYTGVVFEFHYTSSNGNNYGAIGAGGHYGNLVKEIGGPDIEGVGFALGIERLAKIMEDDQLFPEINRNVEVYVMPIGEKAVQKAVEIAFELRLDFFRTEVCYEKKSMSALFKKAERKNAKFAVIIGEDELKDNTVNVKNMLTKEQVNISMQELPSYLVEKLDQNEHQHEHSCECSCCEGEECEHDDCDCDNEEGHCCCHHKHDCNKA